MKKQITNDECLMTNECSPLPAGPPAGRAGRQGAARYFKFLIIIPQLVISLLVISHSAFAQGQGGTDIAVLKAGVGARPLGMGGAFTAVANNADAPYWNPAGLGLVTSNEITTMQTKLSTDADHYYISYVRPALGGSMGLSWVQVGLGNISQTSKEVDLRNEVKNLSVFSYFSNAYLFSYGKNLNDHLSVGLTAKYLTSDMFGISGGQAWGYSVTPGVLLKLTVNSKQLTVGAKVDELINQQKWGTGSIEKVPPKLRLGLAYRLPNPGLFALDISQTIRSGYRPEFSGGYEWAQKGLSLRLGYSEGGLTAGAGFAVKHARIDYAYVTQRALSKDNVHRISLSGVW
jgi:hypothetical protein